MVDTHCPTKPVTRVNPAMTDSSLNNQEHIYLLRARLPAVNQNQARYKSEDNKKTNAERQRLHAQSATREKLGVIENKTGRLLPD